VRHGGPVQVVIWVLQLESEQEQLGGFWVRRVQFRQAVVQTDYDGNTVFPFFLSTFSTSLLATFQLLRRIEGFEAFAGTVTKSESVAWSGYRHLCYYTLLAR